MSLCSTQTAPPVRVPEVALKMSAVDDFLDAGANEPSPFLQNLKAAGGVKKTHDSNGCVFRVNMLNGASLNITRVCNTCGIMETPGLKMKACAGCDMTMYCSRECQKLDWKSHKSECNYATKDTRLINSKIDKWLISMPDMIKNLTVAYVQLTLSKEFLPIVMIRSGKNERRYTLQYGGMGKTAEDVEKIKAMFPEAYHRYFNAKHHARVCGRARLIVIINALGTLSVKHIDIS